MKLLKSLIHKEVRSLYEELVSIRRHLHANPELSFKEKNTSAFIRQILDREGISYTSGYCKYGIVADIRGKKKQKTIYLRGDMDALPIQEVPGRTYGSNVKGVMHACGHDVHTTCVLGSAIILNRLKSHINGTIKIIFQPGEEKLPGGASLMIKEGAVTTDGSSFIYGQHVHPPLETGMVGFRPGEYMASADELFIKVRGKGGHAALPQDCIDTVLVGSEIVTSLHQLVSRYSSPMVPTVLSIGKIQSFGGATNIIPDELEMAGTLRSMDESNRKKMHSMIRQVVKNKAAAYGASAKVQIKYGYPSLLNDEELVERSMDYAREYLGSKNVVLLDKRMTSEDFAYYSQLMPACFYRLGTGNRKKGIKAPVHTAEFDIDETALKVGVGLMSYMALRELQL